MKTPGLIDIHVNLPEDTNEKLERISRFKGEKTFHIVSAIRAYLRKWEVKHGTIDTVGRDTKGNQE